MSEIFISHSSRDDDAAREMQAWLEKQGHRSVFLDFDPESGIVAGQDWEQTLYQKIRACRAVVVLCSVASMDSKWCFTEITHARGMGKELFPVRIDDCKIEGVFTDRQVVDFAEGKDTAYERLRIGLMAAGLDPADAFDWDNSRPPYPGLRAFQEVDAAIFFGRDDEIRTGLDRLAKIHRLGSTAMMMVLGASGAGKSSLVRAGLIPRLRRDTDRWIVLDPVRPRDDIVPGVAHTLAKAFTATGHLMPADDIQRRLVAAFDDVGESDPLTSNGAAAGRISYHGEANPLLDLAETMQRISGHDEARVLLIIDQFEELFCHGSGSSTDFLALVRHAVERPNAPLAVLGTMRSDFLGSLQEDPALIHLDGESLSLGPMPPSGMLDMIVKPAELANVVLQEGLTAQLVQDARDGGTLPLLAFTLHQLHQRYGDDNVLDLDEYRAKLGGLGGSIATVADELIEGISIEDRETLRRTFVEMTRANEDGVFTRRPRRLDEIPPSIRTLIDNFVSSGLLVTRDDGDEATIEVAHEALFSSWGVLAGWLSESAEALRLQHDVDVAARRWDEEGRLPGDLWRGGRLERSRELIDSGDLRLADLDLEFVEESEAAERAEAEEKRRQERALAEAEAAREREAAEAEAKRRKLKLRAVTAGLVVALVFGAFAAVQWRSAVRAAERAAAARLTTVAAASAEDETELGMLAAVASLGITPTPNGWRALSRALSQPVVARTPLEGHLGAVSGLAVSPDATRLASTDWDGSVRIWDAATGSAIGEPFDEGRPLWANVVGFLPPTGDTLVIGGFDATDATPEGFGGIWLRDASTGALLGEPLSGHRSEVISLSFSPDGSQMASVDAEGLTLLWGFDGRAWTARTLLEAEDQQNAGEPGQRVFAVAFHPSGATLAAGGTDGQSGIVWTFDAATGAAVNAGLEVDNFEVYDLAFSADGQLLASVGLDGFVYLSTGDVSKVLGWSQVGGGDTWGNAVAISSDGRTVSTANSDGTVSLFDPGLVTRRNGRVLRAEPRPLVDPLNAHRGETLAVALGQGVLFTGGADGRIRWFDLERGESIGTRLLHADVWSWSGLVDGGSRVASVGRNDALQLWDLTRGLRLGDSVSLGDDVLVWGAALSPDGRLIAAVASTLDDETSRTVLVDAVTGNQIGSPLESAESAGQAFFSSDGVYLAVTDEVTGGVSVWDLRLGPGLASVIDTEEFVAWLGFTPDGSALVSSDFDGTLRRWDIGTATEVGAEMAGHRASVNDVAFAPDGSTMASASSDKTVRLWDLEDGGQIGDALLGHSGQVFALVFSSDGRILASGGQDATILIRRLDDVDNPIALSGHRGPVVDLVFEADGRAIVSRDDTGTTRRWPTPDSWQELACQAAGRNLSLEEWESFVGGDRGYERQCDVPSGAGGDAEAPIVSVQY